jgi:hypothetical protein
MLKQAVHIVITAFETVEIERTCRNWKCGLFVAVDRLRTTTALGQGSVTLSNDY